MTQDAPARPAIVTDQHLVFLDEALHLGERPMFGALLMARFAVTKPQAYQILSYWISTFVDRKRRR